MFVVVPAPGSIVRRASPRLEIQPGSRHSLRRRRPADADPAEVVVTPAEAGADKNRPFEARAFSDGALGLAGVRRIASPGQTWVNSAAGGKGERREAGVGPRGKEHDRDERSPYRRGDRR